MALAERYRFYMMWALLGSKTCECSSHSKWHPYPSAVAKSFYSYWADFNRAQVLLIELIEGGCDE